MKTIIIKDEYANEDIGAYELVYNHGTCLGLYLIPCNDPGGCASLQICINDKNNKKKSFGGNLWFNLPKDFNINEFLKFFSINKTVTFNVGDRVSIIVGPKPRTIYGTVISNSLKNSNRVAVEWDTLCTPAIINGVTSERIEDLTLIEN